MTKAVGVRQGDVLIVPCNGIPESAAVSQAHGGRHILAHGEATGHHHSIALSDRVAMFRDDGLGGGLFLSVRGGPVEVVHQEHTALTIPPGTYQVRRQRVVQSGMALRVID